MAGSQDIVGQLGLSTKARVSFMGRATSVPDLCEDAERLAAGLVERKGSEEGQVTIFMPNCPLAITALLACLAAGYAPRLLDPRAALNDLKPQFADIEEGDLILTVDLSAVQDRLLSVLPEGRQPEVAVARFASQMPFFQRILAPYLRGGTFSRVPAHSAFYRLDKLMGKSGQMTPALSSESEIVVSSGACSLSALVEEAGAQAQSRKGQCWLLDQPLTRRDSLIAVLAAMRKGAELVLSPRLDEDSLKKVEAAAKADLRVPGTRT
ncbi:AMP-binding protein [Fodinicurvata fenggangensis]|uniref:AMP-binding protein n=1 Tax=Fodinicurvata fenggangensis TaxID=1121830 RepID=UPI00047EF1A1|nr:AMP-binding protein [Fodinicurvata fenggangensis]